MITHNATFEDLAKASVKTTDVQVVRQLQDTYGFIDDTPRWVSSDFLMDVKIDSVGEMLGATTKKATVKLLGTQHTVLIADTFQIRLGLYNNDPSILAFNYISQGFFLVETVDYDYDAGYTTIVMYDYMWKANKLKYAESVPPNALTFPLTVQQLAQFIANLLNIGLMANFSHLPNSSYSILEDLYTTISGTTVKNVIQEIAGATGTTARITDNTLVFSQYDVLSQNLTFNELKQLKIGDTYGPVTSVVLGRVPQNDNIAIAASNPGTSTISNVNITTNLMTITGHGMTSGNMIEFVSTVTLPAPLLIDRQYYVFTNNDANTFALAPTYNDAVAGTNLIDLTSAGSGVITVVGILIKEIQINNNEILDDARQSLLPPLYNELSGIDWTDVVADTVGLGWHEVGDVIQFTQGSTTVKAFISEIHLTLAGSVKENLVSKVPDVASIDYTTAGGIRNSIYNTEIKVDKQAQLITSIVSRQDIIENQVNNNFTQISQDVDDVLITVQRAGGGNLLFNSVGFALETFRDVSDISYDKLLSWAYNPSYSITTHGRTTSYSSSVAQLAGGIAGQVIEMSGASMSISQRITVAVGIPLTFAVVVNNVIGTGSATITLENSTDSFVVNVSNAVTYSWATLKIENFIATLPWFDVIITVSAASKFMFTDLRLMYGSTTQGWVQANGEILSANVQFTTDGLRVFDSVHDTETRMSFNEFSTRRKADGEILFEADDLGVLTNDLSIKGRTSYIDSGQTIIKQITLGRTNPKSGLAFIVVS